MKMFRQKPEIALLAGSDRARPVHTLCFCHKALQSDMMTKVSWKTQSTNETLTTYTLLLSVEV